MNEQSKNIEKDRVGRYENLTAQIERLRDILEELDSERADGPCKQNPYTGNTRESRQIVQLEVSFSKTRGGAPAVIEAIHLNAAGIEASDFKRWLYGKITARKTELEKQREAI